MNRVENPEWIEIRDPKCQKVVYVNISNGEYRSDLPPNTLFKPLEEDQWWQFHKTVWKRPSNVDVIPLYKIQQLNNETTKDWKTFINENIENSKKPNPYKALTSRWNLISRHGKYSFSSNNNLDNIKLNSSHVGPSTRLLRQLKSSLSDDECLDTVPHDFCSISNIGYSTMHAHGTRQFQDHQNAYFSSQTKSKVSDGMSRSFDQVNQWDSAAEKTSKIQRDFHHLNKIHERHKPQQNFPRTNPHVTMQRSSSSFRSNKDFLSPKDHHNHHHHHHAIQNAQSVADYLHESATLRRPVVQNHKKPNENDPNPTRSFFASSFNFRSNESNNNNREESVRLLSFKSGVTRLDFDPSPPRTSQPSQSSLMTTSVMSASVKSCDTNDELTSIDQSSFCSVVTRGTDEFDGNSVFSSSSTPPPLITSSLHAWTTKVDDENRNALKKLQRDKNEKVVKRDQRPHGMCYSESDAHWEDESLKFHFSSSGSPHITSFAQFVINEFASSSFNEHRKRFLGKSLPIGTLLNWTKDGIRKPILRSSNRVVNREASDVLKRIQLYMGDRHFKRSQSTTSTAAASSFSSSASLARTNSHKSRDVEPTSLVDQSILVVVVKGWMLPEMRDEIFIQLCKQTNGNPRLDSIQKGWELICICLSFFPPSRMANSLKQRFNETSSSLANCNHPKLVHCLKQLPRRLEHALASGAKRGICKPTAQEFEVSRDSIYTPPLFGSLLYEVMEVQSEKFPNRQLPWILTTLSEAVLRLNGMSMEGIFRIPGDIDEVNRLRAELSDKWAFPDDPLDFDASVPASLLKLWLRQLHEPLIPYDVYNDCLEASASPVFAIDIVSSRLPRINYLVLAYVVRFLQVFAAPPVSSKTKMDGNNLAMVMAPNILRSHITDPNLLLDQAKKEMSFVRLLIMMWDTSFMDNVI